MKKFRVYNDCECYFIDRFFDTHEEAEACVMNIVNHGGDIDDYTIKELGGFYF